MIKNPPAMLEMMVQSLGWKDPLEKEVATHSSILAWRIPWTEEHGGLQSMGRKESDMTEQLHFTSPNADEDGAIGILIHCWWECRMELEEFLTNQNSHFKTSF